MPGVTGAQDPIRVVEAYFAALGPDREAFWASFDRYFDHRTIWENVGLARTVGRDAAVAFAKSFPVDFDYMTVDVLFIAAVGNAVLTERIDYLHDREGAVVATVRVAGTFEIEDGIIREWRDYYDTAGFAADILPQAIYNPRSIQKFSESQLMTMEIKISKMRANMELLRNTLYTLRFLFRNWTRRASMLRLFG